MDAESANLEERKEGKHPLALFPAEVWELIADGVEDFQDLVSLSKAHQFFKILLKTSIPTWKFEKVLPIVLHQLTLKDVLNCRRVNKRWCRAVDRMIQESAKVGPQPSLIDEKSGAVEPLYPPDLESNELRTTLKTMGLLDSASVTSVEAILQKSLQSPSCRFIKREAYLVENVDNPSNDILQFLQHFGQELLSLRVQMTGGFSVEWLTILERFLDLVPNLLRLDLSLLEEEEEVVSEEVKWDLLVYIADAGTVQRWRGFVPKLELLDLDFGGMLGEVLKLFFVGHFGPKLASLTTSRFNLKPNNMQNLAELSLFSISLENLTYLTRLNCRLRKLVLSAAQFLPIQLIFDAVSSFASTLSSLQLCLNNRAYFDGDDMDALAPFREENALQGMDLLRTLVLSGFPPASANWLLGFHRSLTLLKLDFRRALLIFPLEREDDFEGDQVDLIWPFRDFPRIRESDLYGSRIWTLFGRLNEFTVVGFSRAFLEEMEGEEAEEDQEQGNDVDGDAVDLLEEEEEDEMEEEDEEELEEAYPPVQFVCYRDIYDAIQRS